MKKKKIMMKNSKKGLTLVELIVGVAIIAIVFSSTLGAMMGGFTTTVNNADQNKAAIINASVNEIIVNTILDLRLKETSVSATGEINDVRITDSITELFSNFNQDENIVAYAGDATYVKPSEFPKDNAGEFQYTIIPVTDDSSALSKTATDKKSIKGMIVKTYFNTLRGSNIYQSFVPFTKAA